MHAPEFILPDHDGNPVSSTSFAGVRTVVFFYPQAMTPGCTTEACDFRDNYGRLGAAGIAIVGISPDPPEDNARFRSEYALDFPLLSDTSHKVAEVFGAWGPTTKVGRTRQGLIRSTFVLDSHGQIEREYRNVRAAGHVGRLIRDLLG